MKKAKLLCVLLSAAMLAACSGNGAETFTETTFTETSTETTLTETFTETTVTETSAETTFTEADIERAEQEYVQVSTDNEFIDFEFIEDYKGTTDIGDLADKAVKFLKETEFYAKSMENINEFTDEELASYIEDGVIVPKFNTAYPNDYDGDGKTETFIEIDMPYCTLRACLCRFYIFADSGGNMTFLMCSPVWLLYDNVKLLDYGRVKQIILGGDGSAGAESNNELYGVQNGEPVCLYGGRRRYYKNDCFIYTTGWGGGGDFMYYDTAYRKYRAIIGVQLTVDEIRAMDKDGALAEYYGNDEYGDRIYGLVGGKYYCVNFGMNYTEAVFTYDNGKFKLEEDSNVRLNLENHSGCEAVVDIDIEQALKSMKQPIEPFINVPSDAEFIDYNLIGNYPGTTDIGDLADKAVEFLKTTEAYASSMKNADIFTEEGLRRIYMEHDYDEETREEMIKSNAEEYSEYLDGNGAVVPKLNVAYPNDYDGDGKEEAFIVVDMPVKEGTFVSQGMIKSFLIFAGSDGKMQLIDSFSGAYSAVLLDYGVCRHIAIGGSGPVGAADHTILYGVRDGRAVVLYSGRCGFYKEDCFLAVYGWQGSGDFMYYDTKAQEYFAVGSVDINIYDIKKLDKDNVLKEYYDDLEDGYPVFVDLIGGKYYCVSQGVMDTGSIYTYENGRLVPREDCYARCSEYYEGTTVNGLDADKAIAQMKPVPKPVSPVTKGSTPIDFKYIENLQSDTDFDQYKKIIGEFIEERYAYSGSKSHIHEMVNGDFAEYVDQYGKLAPKITAAYTNDYDGDGKNETFVVFELPYPNYENFESRLEVQSFTVLINSGGEISSGEYYRARPAGNGAALLDCGAKKHILFIGGEEHTVDLYGVQNGSTKAYFNGRECTVKKDGCLLDISYGGDGGCVLYYDNLADDYVTLSGRNFSDGSDMPNPVSMDANT